MDLMPSECPFTGGQSQGALLVSNLFLVCRDQGPQPPNYRISFSPTRERGTEERTPTAVRLTNQHQRQNRVSSQYEVRSNPEPTLYDRLHRILRTDRYDIGVGLSLGRIPATASLIAPAREAAVTSLILWAYIRSLAQGRASTLNYHDRLILSKPFHLDGGTPNGIRLT